MKMRITKQDVKETGYYSNCQTCLIATMLRRRGHIKIRVGGFEVSTNRGSFRINNAVGIPKLYDDDGNKILKTSVNKTIELVPIRAAA